MLGWRALTMRIALIVAGHLSTRSGAAIRGRLMFYLRGPAEPSDAAKEAAGERASQVQGRRTWA